MMTVQESDKLDGFKLHDLRCFDAVVRLGSFQAAARSLHRTHPSVFAAVGRLEARLSLTLLDRSGYRAVPTAAGCAVHERVAALIADMAHLAGHAARLAGGDEPVLRIVIGDLCPRPAMLAFLAAFFAAEPVTRLHLDYEAVGGPAERLEDNTADLILHRTDDGTAPVERIDLAVIHLLPVTAPGFLPPELVATARPDQLQRFTQCVIRDTATRRTQDHFIVPGAHRCSVPDNEMKKALIAQGLAWGHLPDFMIRDDLASGALLRVGGRHMPGRTETLSAQRRADRSHGPVAARLWRRLSAGVDGLGSLSSEDVSPP